VVEAKTIDSTLDIVEGMGFDKDIYLPIRDQRGDHGVRTRGCIPSDQEMTISGLQDLLLLLQSIAKVGRPLVCHRKGH